jgi:transposase-like protein
MLMFIQLRGDSRTALQALLGKTMRDFRMPGEFPGDMFAEQVDRVKAQCSVASDQHDVCTHMAQHRYRLSRRPGPPQYALLQIIEDLWSSSIFACRAVSGLLINLVTDTAKMIDMSIEAGKFKVDPLQLGTHRTRKRSRIDEDFKDSIVNLTIQKKRARNGAASLRAMATDMHPQTAHKWTAKFMVEYQCALFRAADEVGVIGIQEDAARVGEPPEETQLFLAWCANTDRALVLPPMVTRPISL